MEIAKENSTTTLMEVDIGNSMDSFQRFLVSQKELFHSQIDQLQKIVVTQCKLTGANPLSQEMAAGALSINIGKRPRDLLNPKAVKYMQSVFSIKDTISKKESREISALFGVTITQVVREFFASQRSRVRKHVRLAREKAIKSDKCNTSQDGWSTSSDPATAIIDQAPLNTLDPKVVEEAPSSTSQEETIPGIDAPDKNFVDNIFNLMRREETFSGQVKLMEWILRIQNSSVLFWFLAKGGLMILAAWLSTATIEEQTTVLLVILKVLCHLPLHKALPLQMSAILQTVNRLRFYRTSDISNRAKVLLSRWSKLFVRSQALKKSSFTDSPNDTQKDIIQNMRTGEMINSELQSKVDLPEDILAFSLEGSENYRKSEPPQGLKLLPASADDSNKRHNRSVSSTQTRERRKVLLVEQPGRNSTGRSLQVPRPVSANQGRPMSADDIQKAKMRAIFMQSKYGKIGSSSNENHQQKTEVPNRPSATQTSPLLSASRTSPVKPKIEEKTKPVFLASETSPTLPEPPIGSKLSLGSKDPSWEKLKRDRIPWQMPPEIRLNSLWRVGTGENGKEVEIQRDRMRREKEIIYQRIQDIPSNPKEPWDREMDYDDTLTPEIPTEQPPDADGAENLSSPHNKETIAAASSSTPVPVTGNAPEPEPDLELLAVLLKNPDLVFALTSGQGGNITSEETVKLLDMIKTNGIGLPTGVSNGLVGGNTGNLEMTSLPSPTPPSEIRMNRWRSEVAKDPIPQPFAVASRETTVFPAAAAPTISMSEKLPATGLIRPQTPKRNFSMLQSPSNKQQQLPVINSEYLPTGLNPHSNPSSSLAIPQFRTNNPSSNQVQPNVSSLQQNMLAAGLPLLQPEAVNFGQMHNVKPAAVSIVLNHLQKDRTAVSLPSMLQTPMRPQPTVLPEPTMIQTPQISWQWNEVGGNSVSNSGPPPQVNQNNYNVFARGMRPSMPQYPSWERNEYVGEQDLENWSPDRSPERSPEYRSGRNFSEPRRDTGGRNSRNDWSRRWDSGRRDSSRNGGNRRWRDRRS
ncbi:Homeobox domain [Macleaya cordata]|uniref:Homeobox domain n=1 Tax=Macleaya cordata TaxID=56857 RepID=A0A200Q1I8_MACCD|nr:Homeobox domain [Macleaya cordata]